MRTETTGAGRGTVMILVARVFQLISGFGVSVILARGLGPVEFGIYGVVMSLLTWLERIVNGGVPAATAAVMSRMPEQRSMVEQSARFLMVLYMLPIFGLAWVFAPALAGYLDMPSGTTLIRIALLNLPVMALYFAYEGIFGGRRVFALQSLLHIIQSAAKFAGIVLLLFIGLTVAGTFVVHVAATAVTMLLVGVRHRVGGGRVSWTVIREMIGIALPVGAYSVALAVLMNLSLWQLQSAAGQPPEDIGYFAAGINLTRIMMLVPASVSGVLYASLVWAISASQPEQVKKYVQGAVRFAVIVMVPACALLGANATEVMELLYGQEYAAGGGILAVLCIAFSMTALCDVLLVAPMAGGRLVLSAGVLAALIPVLYVLNVIWIDANGAVGAASASAVALGVGTVAAAVLTHARLAPPLRLATAARVGGAGLVIGIASMMIPAAGPWLLFELAGLGSAYLGMLWLTGEITLDEVRHLVPWKAARR